jgi:hypothetical protein
MREENLFYKLTNNNENATTELLCNLCKFEKYKEIIFKGLNLDDKDFGYGDMDTQYDIPDKKKRPDIVIENSKMKIFIENKTSKTTPLQSSQLTDYPKHLKSNKNKDKNVKLIFLIPNGYKHEDKIVKVKEKYKVYDLVSIIFWDDLLEKMKTENKDIKSEILDESISFFEKVLKSIPEVKFEQEEIDFMTDIKKLGKESKAIGKTLELFENVIGQLRDNLKLKFKKGESLAPTVSEDCIGYYFYKENCYIGYYFVLNNDPKLKDYVLSFAINKDIISRTKLKNVPKSAYYLDEDEEWYYFKIDNKMLKEKENVKKLFQYCKEVMKNVVKEIN